MAELNNLLRQARERTESPNSSGDCLSRQELAELVNAWVFERTGRVIDLNAGYVGKLEQGTIRWPQDPIRRAGFRAVLGVETDAEIGLRRPRRNRTTLVSVDRHEFIRLGLGVGVATASGPPALIALLGSRPTRQRLAPAQGSAGHHGQPGDLVRQPRRRTHPRRPGTGADRPADRERTRLATRLSRHRVGQLGRVQEMRAAIGRADEEFARRRPAEELPSTIPYDAETHSSHLGFAMWEPALHGRFVDEARQRLSDAVAGFGDTRARGRARSQTKLAAIVMATGDPTEAATIGLRALDATGACAPAAPPRTCESYAG